VGDPNPKDKMSGTGAPGSHSAVFGLTPDGKKNTDTSSGSGAPKAAHSEETAVGGGKQSDEGDTGSRAPSGNKEVSEQMQKVDADKGPKPGDAPAGGDDGDQKPGAGSTGLEQGSGKV
jgi:hypothetical protein